jgi:hypothetical protein
MTSSQISSTFVLQSRLALTDPSSLARGLLVALRTLPARKDGVKLDLDPYCSISLLKLQTLRRPATPAR